MLEMGLHDSFEYLKHKLWPKEGRESNWQFDSRPLKVRNRPNFLVFKWRVTYHWKDFNEGRSFALELIAIGGLHAKLYVPKITGVLVMRIPILSLGSPGIKCHLNVGLVEKHIVYYKGEGGGFPQIRAVVSFMSSNLPVVRPNTKTML